MAETAFGVTYDGPAVADHRMPVRELAPALLALGEVFTEASFVLYPDREPVALDVKATAEGSFMVDLILQSGVGWDEIRDFLSSDAADALSNLEAIVLGIGVPTGGGLFWLIKKLKNRRILDEDEKTVLPGQTRLTLDDGSVFEASAEAVRLYKNVRIRKSTRAVVEPLTRDGVERLDFRIDSETTLSVGEDEVSAFEVPEVEPLFLIEDESTRILSITTVAFPRGNKWRFSDGASTFHAVIEDEQFLGRVANHTEVFGSGDMLRCRLRVVQTQTDGSLHTEYFVKEVLEHIRPEPHPQLWPDDEPRTRLD